MSSIQKTIQTFFTSNKIATICFVDNDKNPYCINCFYVFDEINNVLIFKSSLGTTHHEFIKSGAQISGTVLPDTLDTLKIRGVQYTGSVIDSKETELLKLNSLYFKKYPMSLALAGYGWAVKLEYIKFTDNTLGFGNKTIWEKE